MPWSVIALIISNPLPIFGIVLIETVKLFEKSLHCVADISTAQKLLEPTTVSCIYLLCFLLMIIDVGIDLWKEGRRAGNAEILDRP